MTCGKTEIVMDTNVAIVANGKADQAGSNCIRKCVERLLQMVEECRVLLDNRSLILDEYRKNLSPSGQPGPGDAFFKWLFDNQGNLEHCRKVGVNLDPEREFEEFPVDPKLSSFDRSDRKFVAVVLASGTSPEVLNASDSDWWHHWPDLQHHGIEVVFLCPELMKTR